MNSVFSNEKRLQILVEGHESQRGSMSLEDVLLEEVIHLRVHINKLTERLIDAELTIQRIEDRTGYVR